MTTNELLEYLLNDVAHPLAEPLAAWLHDSPRFAAFAITYRDKIRKKLRLARDGESARDLLYELETAYVLLRNRRVAVAYEPYSANKTRGPDFAVMVTAKLTVNVEVTRIRASSIGVLDPQQINQRFEDTVCGKLGQTIAGMFNVLIVVAHNATITRLDIEAALKHLKLRAEARDERLFSWYNFGTPTEFFKQYERLSAVVLRTALDDPEPLPAMLWLNPQARRPLPERVRTILQSI